jgi:UDP-N-acetylmuramyl pentapeptide phosphotransferase/UDP-N-acetylglucosamine-1-phosphate transferase
MFDKIKPIAGGILIIIVFVSVLSLFTNTTNRLILLISPRVLDIGCAGTVLFLIGLNVLRKTWAEIKTAGRIDVFRWLGLLIATLLFIGFYQIIDTINPVDQYGWGFFLFLLLGMIAAEFFPHSSNTDNDKDDYHARH